jgi:hypothetical protein
MDDKFYRNRARVLRELAYESDPLIKRRRLRLANNYENMTTPGDQAEKPELGSKSDSRDSN